jgi:hypothetical protein
MRSTVCGLERSSADLFSGEVLLFGVVPSGESHESAPAVSRRLTSIRYPDLVSHVFAVCTPYAPPPKDYVPIEQLVNGPLPQFAYQIHLASGEVEKSVKDEQSIRQFLKGMYGGRGPNGELAFDPCKGLLVENLPGIGDSPLLTGKVSIRKPLRTCRGCCIDVCGAPSSIGWKSLPPCLSSELEEYLR